MIPAYEYVRQPHGLSCVELENFMLWENGTDYVCAYDIYPGLR
jgi:hypothetical protein